MSTAKLKLTLRWHRRASSTRRSSRRASSFSTRLTVIDQNGPFETQMHIRTFHGFLWNLSRLKRCDCAKHARRIDISQTLIFDLLPEMRSKRDILTKRLCIFRFIRTIHRCTCHAFPLHSVLAFAGLCRYSC